MNTNSLFHKMRWFFGFLCLCLNLGWAAGSHAQSIDELALTCATCHGEDGNAVSDIWPNLAGQKKGYLITQMKAFRDGVRTEPTMAASVEGLTDESIVGLAEHYAGLPARSAGGTVSEDGKNVRALCIACHGVEGKTVNTEWPNLAGQNAAYLKAQLLAFKSGARVSPEMNLLMRDLSEEHIAAVAEYYSNL